jgi:hypothetical protein
MKRSLSREPLPYPHQRFSCVSGTRHKVSAFKARERREPFGLRLAAIALRRTVMLSYEMFAIGIAVVLVPAAIGALAACVMMSPEEMALLRFGRAAAAQRWLVASAAQQERDARAAAAQRRLVAAAAQQDDRIRHCLKRLYEDALAAPLSPRLATLITQLETQGVSA